MTTKTPSQELREIAANMSAHRAHGDYRALGWIDALASVADRIERDHEDAERLRAIADFEAVAINAHIVQVRRGDDFHTAYHKAPPSGVPKVLFDGDKLAALRAAVDSARGK